MGGTENETCRVDMAVRREHSRHGSDGGRECGRADSTTTTGAVLDDGPTTNGNAKAAKAVKNDPLTGTAGSGLTRGVTSSSRQGRLLPAAGVLRRRGRRLQGTLRAGEHEQGAPGRSHDRLLGLPGRRQQPADQPADRPEARPAGSVLRDRRHLGQRAHRASTDFMNTQPGAVLRLGLPAGLLPHPLGLRLQRLPDHRNYRTTPKVYQANLALGPIEAAGLRRRAAGQGRAPDR